MIGIVLGIGLFMFLVIIHELGHFIAAKRSGVKVLEFGIGIPPKIFTLRTDKSGTQYTINRIPLGGFVRLKGEDPQNTSDFTAKDSFIKATIRRKIIILLGGVTANFLFAWLVFTIIFTHGIRPISIIPENALITQSHSYLMPTASFLQEQGFLSGTWVESPALIADIAPNMLGVQLGLQKDDTILRVNDKEVNALTITMVLQKYIGQDITLDIMRHQKPLQFTGVCPDDNCLLGIALDTVGTVEIQPIKFPFPQSIAAGWREMGAQARLTFHTLGSLGADLLSFNGTKINASVDKLSGPVGIVKIIMKLVRIHDRSTFFALCGLISLALALFNILPIPALDGGRLLGVLIQRIGRLKAEKYFTIEGYINLVFFVLLMGLGIYIMFKDFMK